MFEELLNMFLIDSEMTLIFAGLFLIFTAFSLFLLYRISHKIYSGIAVAVALITAADAAVFATAGDWGVGFVSMYAGMLLVPLAVSLCLAFLIYKIIRFSVTGKILCAVLAVTVIMSACIFWPEPLEEKTGSTDTNGIFYYYDGKSFEEKQAADNTQLELVLSQINCTPCVFTPGFSEDCIVIRLNEDYVLLSERYEDSYIFKYGGAIEDFKPENACFKVYRNKPLYISIKTS